LHLNKGRVFLATDEAREKHKNGLPERERVRVGCPTCKIDIPVIVTNESEKETDNKKEVKKNG